MPCYSQINHVSDKMEVEYLDLKIKIFNDVLPQLSVDFLNIYSWHNLLSKSWILLIFLQILPSLSNKKLPLG